MQVSQHVNRSEANLCSLKILYQLSIDDGSKSIFAYSGMLPILMDLLLEADSSEADAKDVQSTLLSLLVNLSQSETNSEVIERNLQSLKRVDLLIGIQVMSEERLFKPLMKRAIRDGQSLMYKVHSLPLQHDVSTFDSHRSFGI